MAGVELCGVGLVYQAADGSTTRALDGLSLTVGPGEAVCLIGPSGCGKSSLLELVAGLRRPTLGTVRVGGEAVTAPRRGTGYIPQGGGLLPWKTALGNVGLGLAVQHTAREARLTAARRALTTVGLAERAKAYPGELSGGERQRLAVARCLAADCDVILADEPFSALDALTREQMQAVLLELWLDLGYTQIMVTHSVEEAVWLGQRILIITARPGRLYGVVDNPGVGTPGWRGTAEFATQAARVRSLLDEASRPSGAPGWDTGTVPPSQGWDTGTVTASEEPAA